MTHRERIRELADGTRTAREIAAAVKVSVSMVQKLAKAEALPIISLGTEEWPGDRTAELRRLWASGLSITKIGLALGVSRNAVAAKANRLKLSSRASPVKPGGKKPGRKPQPVRKPTVSERAIAHNGPGIPLLDRRRSDCAYAIGDPKEFRCCGAPVHKGSFCEFHAAKVYKKEIPKQLKLPGERKRRVA